MNTQPSEKPLQGAKLLDVHSIFATIQGEGPYSGRPAIFIRLAGCNLQCPLCDTDYTSNRQQVQPREVIDAVQRMTEAASWGHLVVITGGEPMRQPLGPLVSGLSVHGYRVQIETNGTLPVPMGAQFADIVCSPKTGTVNRLLLPYITAWKYVLREGSVDPKDGLPVLALDHPAAPCVARPPKSVARSKIYIQPADEKDSLQNRRNLECVIRSCTRFGYTLGIQLHKYLNME